MQSLTIPEGNQAVMPYLVLTDAAGFMRFTRTVFGALPGRDLHYRPDSRLLMHAEVIISGSTVMFCDAHPGAAPATANLFVWVACADETYAQALAAGAVSVMEPADQSYGRSCGVTDPFGNVWWITSLIAG